MPTTTTAPATTAVREKVPVAPESLNIAVIRSGIPKELLKQNTGKALMYIARDCAQVAATYLVWSSFIEPTIFPALAELPAAAGLLIRVALWNLYWWVQGMNFTALWVAGGHEAGHGAVSSSKTVNELVGFVFHTFLLVPYHAWRVSHATHHKYTNHLGLDTVFVPHTEDTPLKEAIGDAPVVALVRFFLMLTLGWPLYLILNVAGQNFGRRTNHFEPSSPLFRNSDRWGVIVSNIGILAMLLLLGIAAKETSLWTVVAHYGMPYLWTNAWLVYITFMHHHDTRVPHYDDANFNFVRGALCSVDRDYGWLVNSWLHHINDSHVVHHLFHDMPWFNAIEVTRKYIKPALGKHYASDSRNMWTQTWESWSQCLYLIPSEGIAYFRQ